MDSEANAVPESPVALVTGSGRGIGAATALRLARAGYRVCINYRVDRAAADRVLEDVRRTGVKAIAVQADVGEEADVMRLFETLDAELGALSVLVNNAGILMQQTTIAGLDAARVARILKTNVTGTILCCREAVKRMSRHNGGRGGAIVNVSSVAARTGSPGEYLDYAASKAGVDAVTRGLAREVADEGIRVNAVRPGFISTDMHADGGEPGRVERLAPSIPLGRGGEPGEVAELIAWLLSDEASFVTGSLIDIAGGR